MVKFEWPIDAVAKKEPTKQVQKKDVLPKDLSFPNPKKGNYTTGDRPPVLKELRKEVSDIQKKSQKQNKKRIKK